MDKKIRQILNDIYMIDNSLRDKEKDLIKIIEELASSRPNTKFDENFAKRLRLEIAHRLKSADANEIENKTPAVKDIFARRFAFSFIGVALIILVLVPAIYRYGQKKGGGLVLPAIIIGGKIDDWKLNSGQSVYDSISQSLSNLGATTKSVAPGANFNSAKTENIGLAVGGAKDINNFRANIANNYLPLPTDITYEGLFYDYFFDTGASQACDKLFCPSYSYAISNDPFSKNEDYYLSVGLNSNIKESDFARKKLNLVVVLDVSGSMGSPFDRYYYDQFGNRTEYDKTNDADARKKKIEVAANSVVALLGHLNNDDRFGMVVFDGQAYLAKPLDLVGETDMEKVKNHILELNERGGTQMSAGMKMGTELFSELKNANQNEYENRIIFLTDAMPNIGETSEGGLLGMLKINSENKIYTTFIGMGVDFNTELVDYITKIRGANYYSVHSAAEFKKRMDSEFDYMVTPLVFNLALNLDAQGYEIEKVYGSPEANEATGEIMKVNTLFPSKTENGETKGGIVLLKLKKLSSDASLKLKVSYEDRNGKKDTSEQNITFGQGTEYFGNNGIRKGILLARYADLMKNWINDERVSGNNRILEKPSVDREVGIIVPSIPSLGQWERQSMPLRVSSQYKELFSEFKTYFKNEMNSIGDSSLDKEVSVLDKLIR